MPTVIFLHGLESSSRGTKARWFKARFPRMLIPDFSGDFQDRLHTLRTLAQGRRHLVLVGSSFGGLMAAAFALENGEQLTRVILLAPALNFPDFFPYADRRTAVPAHLVIGRQDTVCPPSEVIPAAKAVFVDLSIRETEDDHLLHRTFPSLDWPALLGP